MMDSALRALPRNRHFDNSSIKIAGALAALLARIE
jgi:hypothetical protein